MNDICLISRPAYLQVLAIVLVVLIGVSALMELRLRGLNDLAARDWYGPSSVSGVSARS